MCDVQMVIGAIDTAAQYFDVDTLSLKNASLSNAAKSAKTPEEFIVLSEALLQLINDLVTADQYDVADKAAMLAIQCARKSGDAGIVARCSLRSKEVAEAKTLFLAMKSVLQIQAKSPEDPVANLEIGRFLCFVKGSWDLGLRFMSKGSDPLLKPLAEKELASLAQPEDLVGIADSWFEISEKEKSPLRKSQLQAHTQSLYEAALPSATALVRVKIEKRLEAMTAVAQPGMPGLSVDLLKLIDVNQDAVKGEWVMEGRVLVSPATQSNPERIALPYLPPDEYDLVLVLERRQGTEAFQVMVPSGSAQCAIVLDSNGSSGIDVIDGKVFGSNASSYSGKVFVNNRPATVNCAIRKGGITVTVDGKIVIRWQGNRNSLAAVDYFRFPNARQAYLGCGLCRYAISKITLISVSGEGKKLR